MGERMTVLLFILLVVVVLLANSMILLRTARKPKIPKSVKPLPDNDRDGDW
ncbi:MAG: hypothetical protein VX679_05260 [Pseudomonadota bacterium]|jgi:hypothetical protein|nr:hypothetical protein [Pseudomonadota bacterium]